MRNLLLFDIDSVLVEPNGYWASIQETVGLYARSLGYGPDGVPSPADIQVFEACGLSSEWDSCPMCVGALLIGALGEREVPPPDRLVRWLFEPFEPLPESDGAAPRLPAGFFAALARHVREAGLPGERPPAAALRVLTGRAPGALWMAMHALLDDTHDLARAPVTQIFQHFVLGHEGFRECYARPQRFETPSLLASHDRPLLTPDGRARLLDLLARGRAHGACLYTARPSYPPRDAGAGRHDFSPEAEIAAVLVKLEHLPLIGFGRTRWLAARRGRRSDAYVKPSPVQALAAIGAALGAGESAALEAAAALVENGALVEPFATLRQVPACVYVFEDSERGARAVLDAVALLQGAACQVRARVAGVAAPDGVKAHALAEVAEVMVPDVNAGIAWLAAFL